MADTHRKLPNAIPILFTKGTSYEIGYNIGQCFADRIKTYFSREGLFLDGLNKFYCSKVGQSHLQPYLKICEERFPNYMAEMKGTADGANVPLDKIIVCNFWRELCSHPDNPLVATISKPSPGKEPVGCTDIILNNGTTKVLGHNEDGELTMNDIDYIICVEIEEYIATDGRVFPAEKFVAHTYPGVLPGACFAFNQHGLGYSINTCWSKEIPENRLGESFHLRRCLTAKNKEDLLEILKDSGYGSTTGIGLNAGFLDDPNMYSFEIAPNMEKPENKVAMVTVANDNNSTPKDGPFYCRTNHPILLDSTPMFSSMGTVYRYDRVHQLEARNTRHDVLTMLGDTSHPEYPIFRSGRSQSDKVSGTACTSLIDFKERTLNVYKNNPKEATGPVLSLPMTIFR